MYKTILSLIRLQYRGK